MKRRLATAAIIALLMFSAAPRADDDEEFGYDDLEQIPNCGATKGLSKLWQYEPTYKGVAGFSQTTRDYNGCFSGVRVEAWINAMPSTSNTLITDQAWGGAAAVYWLYIPVPTYGEWRAQGKHLIVNGRTRILMDNSISEPPANVQPPPTGGDDESGDDPEPREDDGTGGDPDSTGGSRCSSPNPDDCPWSPILLDLAHDGFHLTSVEDGVLFDLNADGQLDRVSWTRANSDDAWLAMDRNGNGVIDDGTELFGNRTPAFVNERAPAAPNGFVALDYLQGPDYGRSYADKKIDRRDAPFARLLLWRDLNHDGISQANELQPAGNTVVSIGLDYKESRKQDAFGNLFTQRALATFTDGEFFVMTCG